MKLCNCVVLELLVLPEHFQNAFETTTPEPTRFMLTDLAHYLLICLLMASKFCNGCNWRFVHKIMQCCCFGAAGTSCTLSEGARDFYNRTNKIYVDRLGVLPIDMYMNGTANLQW